jgi:DNA polymerase I
MKKLLLIDASSIIYRCFHALPPLNSSSGIPTQAIYGVASVLIRLWRESEPAFAASLFDRPEPTFRKKEYAEYKAHRPPAPSELVQQIIGAHQLFELFGIRTFEAPGWEADDLIATLAHRFGDEHDVQVEILTGDLDTLQLVRGDKVVVKTFRKGISDTMTYNEPAVLERYGLRPDQLVDYKALVGDTSDNIKGIQGIGPKTACAILQEYGTLDEALNGHPGKLQDKVLPWRAEIEAAKRLVLLKDYEPLPVSHLSELAVSWDPEALKDYFRSLGFETLAKRLDGEDKKPARAAKTEETAPKEPPAPEDKQGSFF